MMMPNELQHAYKCFLLWRGELVFNSCSLALSWSFVGHNHRMYWVIDNYSVNHEPTTAAKLFHKYALRTNVKQDTYTSRV
jgi:hypothetical protein